MYKFTSRCNYYRAEGGGGCQMLPGREASMQKVIQGLRDKKDKVKKEKETIIEGR